MENGRSMWRKVLGRLYGDRDIDPWNVGAPSSEDESDESSRTFKTTHALEVGGPSQEDWELYLTSPPAFAAVEAVTFAVLSAGFEIHSESEQIRERYTRRFDKVFPKLYSVMRDALVFGDSYSRILFGRDNHFTDIEVLFPLNVVIQNGNYFVREGGKLVRVPNIWHFQAMARTDSPFGISMIGVARQPLKWKKEIDESVHEGIIRHGFAKYHIQCLPDRRGLYPDENKLKELEREFRKIHVGHEFVSTDKVKIDPIDTSGFPALLDYLQYYTSLAATGLMVPAETLGQGIATSQYATAKVRMEFFLKNTIPYFQRVLECSINDNLMGEKAEGAIFKLNEPKEISYKTG